MQPGCFDFADLSIANLLDDGSVIPIPSQSTLHLYQATIGERHVVVAATNPDASKGVLGLSECLALEQAVALALNTAMPLVLLIDSAGARLNDGLPITGAFRRLIRVLLDAHLDGLHSIALLGRNVFGGASMLSFTVGIRYYREGTRLAMSGPRILQADNGLSSAEIANIIQGISRVSRCGWSRTDQYVGSDNHKQVLLQDLLHSSSATPDTLLIERTALRERLINAALRPTPDALLFDGISSLTCIPGIVAGAADTFALAEAIDIIDSDIAIAMGWTAHSTCIDDEQVLLTQYLVHLAKTIRTKVRQGHQVTLTITGEISGGIYLATAGAASEVRITPDSVVRTLPQRALDAIFSEPPPIHAAIAPSCLIDAGIADQIFSPEENQ